MKSSLTSFAVATAALMVALAAATPAQARDARVRIVNRSSSTVYSINISPPARRRYGDQDLLGSNVLRAGYNTVVDFNVDDAENHCVLDVRAKGPGNIKWTRQIDVCDSTEWILRDDD